MDDPLELRLVDVKSLRADCKKAGKHLSITPMCIIDEKTKKMYCSHCSTLYDEPLTKQEQKDYLASRNNAYKQK